MKWAIFVSRSITVSILSDLLDNGNLDIKSELMSVRCPTGIGNQSSVPNYLWVTDLTLWKKKKKNVDVAVKVGCYWQPREAFLDQNHCHSFPGCLANLLVCWIFRICVWIMSLLGTSIWVLLYKMSSFTATDFISSWSCNDAGCFVAAISSCNLLLGVSVKIQSIIYLSVQISFRSWFLVARAVI